MVGSTVTMRGAPQRARVAMLAGPGGRRAVWRAREPGARGTMACRASQGGSAEDEAESSRGASVEAQRSSLERVYWTADAKDGKGKTRAGGKRAFRNPFARDEVFSGTAAAGRTGQQGPSASSSSSGTPDDGAAPGSSSSSWRSGGRADGEKPLTLGAQLKRFQRYLADKNGIDLK